MEPTLQERTASAEALWWERAALWDRVGPWVS